MLERAQIAALIPHAGAMCLLDAVSAWDGLSIDAVSHSHTAGDHPLRRAGRLHAVHLIEFGAQACAVHGALKAREAGLGKPRPGMLVSLRDVRLSCEYVSEDGALRVCAHCLFADEGGAQYRFSVWQSGVELASGRCAVIHPRED